MAAPESRRKKKIRAVVKLQIPAGQATPAPPVGTALGPHGVNIMEFVRSYNERTASQTGTVVPVQVTIYEDRTFEFVLKTPPASVLLKQAAGAPKGSPDPHKTRVGSVSRDELRRFSAEIAEELLRRRTKLLIVACNSATAAALPSLQRRMMQTTLGVEVLGVVRPEALRVERGEPGDGTVRATVEHVEYLGHETLAHVSVEGDGAVRLVARVEGMLGFTRGEAVSLLVDPQAVHLFDGNGRSLDG